MLSITTKSPYALRALTELGADWARRSPSPIGELARRREIPVQFLEQLFAVLRRAGLLQARSAASRAGTRSRARPPTSPFSSWSSSSTAASAREARTASSPTPPRRPATVLGSTTIADVVEREAAGRRRGDVLHLVECAL